ncbi:FkbM family methyltransferase [Acidihalobacter aeolianus]|uniref:FkbM family methyltransferase n=1 Tax=Acidihalobacter aeolianus TaxID=2792603 RepID=UPI0009F27BDE|nr:FkbM family methyltransferase [Acidihalobacter aeolianus]
MGITSYAQNFEDVILWRALGSIENGCYIDIGANDPVIDSVSHAFYERGWRGINVEPVRSCVEKLLVQRPEDKVIEAVVGLGKEDVKFYEVSASGISTVRPDYASQYEKYGYSIIEREVLMMPLSKILNMCSSSDVHWLKVDVEGNEAEVLMSWTPSTVRPWVVLVESTKPMTQNETHKDWEKIILNYGYKFVYFDGLNRFYVSLEHHKRLKNSFKSPPNVFDEFILSGKSNASFHRAIRDMTQKRKGKTGSQ